MEWFKMQTCWGEAVDMLTDEEAGRLFKNIYAYVLRGETRKGAGREDLMAMIVLEMLKRDIEKYEAGAAEEEKKKEQKRQRAGGGGCEIASHDVQEGLAQDGDEHH